MKTRSPVLLASLVALGLAATGPALAAGGGGGGGGGGGFRSDSTPSSVPAREAARRYESARKRLDEATRPLREAAEVTDPGEPPSIW